MRVAYVAQRQPKRLIVFVHGFLGNAVNTWDGMKDFSLDDEFWMSADMLFIGYRSFTESIKGVADRIRRKLPTFYPIPHPSLEKNSAGNLRATNNAEEYTELYLVGHSLGGLIIRRLLLDDLVEWSSPDRDSGMTRPCSLVATVRLFSPANAGYRPAGLLSLLRKDGLGGRLLMFSAAFADLQVGSEFLRATRDGSEQKSLLSDGAALRARVLWANPENVVETSSYSTDSYSHSVAQRKSHIAVCKPSKSYETPWTFIETGHL